MTRRRAARRRVRTSWLNSRRSDSDALSGSRSSKERKSLKEKIFRMRSVRFLGQVRAAAEMDQGPDAEEKLGGFQIARIVEFRRDVSAVPETFDGQGPDAFREMSATLRL